VNTSGYPYHCVPNPEDMEVTRDVEDTLNQAQYPSANRGTMQKIAEENGVEGVNKEGFSQDLPGQYLS